ncbi:MAG: dihydroorotate dehydrogenase electron transfer subunit [Bacteroidales bacterium]|nr:dihydroorotate dehydrogenase electron transfer subunit [Bacteroidales bacterium]
MQKKVYKIAENRMVAADTYQLKLTGNGPVSGEFVHLEIPGFYLRRPFSVCEVFEDGFMLLYKTVGEGTRKLAALPEGKALSVLTGLGKGFSADACRGSALLVGGGLGAAPLFLLARQLKAQGKRITAVLGFNKADEIVLKEEFEALCDTVAITTLDGSVGIKGFVTDALKEMACAAGHDGEYDFFYTCGPMVMMKAVCGLLSGPGEASLEERMGCGAGFCYGCSIQTTAGPRRVCKDGPVFNKEEILW